MESTNVLLKSIEEARDLEKEYKVPTLDIMLISLNREGVNSNLQNAKRVRFEMKPNTIESPYYFALTNTKESRWTHNGKELKFQGTKIGESKQCENDTCDTTYFRRFVIQKGKKIGTELTINSNSRSTCRGCSFCGTYSLNTEDAEEKDLTSAKKIRKKINQILIKESIEDLSHLVEVGVVTGCFPNESETLEHLIMMSQVLRQEYKFQGELKYVGSQITSVQALKKLAEQASPVGISLTIECFTRRNKLLKKEKQISLEKGRELLDKAKEIGIKTTILYIIGLDPLAIFEAEIQKYASVLTKFPVINVMQEYVKGQSSLIDPQATNIRYYLEARKILEKYFGNVGFKPQVWENYRGLFFTNYNGGQLNGINI